MMMRIRFSFIAYFKTTLCSLRARFFWSPVRWPEIEPASGWAHVYVQNASGTNQNHDVGQETCCGERVSYACSPSQSENSATEVKKKNAVHTVHTDIAPGYCKTRHIYCAKYLCSCYRSSISSELLLYPQLTLEKKLRWPPGKLVFWILS